MVKHKPFVLWLLLLAGTVAIYLAWPAMPLPWLSFVAFIPLLYIEDYVTKAGYKKPGRRFYGYAFVGLFLFNAATTFWVRHATGIGTVAMLAINAFFMSIPWLAYHHTKRAMSPKFGHIALVIFWLAFEWVHLNWELSWPWLTLGNVFAMYPAWVQWYQFTGALGGSAWVLLVNLLLYIALFQGQALFKGQVRWLSLAYIVLLGVGLPGLVSYLMYANHQEQGTPQEVVVVQPNVDPYTKQWFTNAPETPTRRMGASQQMDSLIALMDRGMTPGTRWVAWPENGVPGRYYIEGTYSRPRAMQSLEVWKRRQPRLSFLGGLTTQRLYGDSAMTATARHNSAIGWYDFNNAAIWLPEPGMGLTDFYHKSRLLPGMERFPYPKLLGFLGPVLEHFGGTMSSFGMQETRPVFYNSDSVGMAPAICYESIYGGFLTQYVRNGAGMLFIITNDAWWSNSPGHRQHLHYARLRALETRRPVARAANTGISAFINQRGDITQQLPFWERGTLNGTLMANDTLTFYARHGDYLGRTAAWMAPFILLSVFVRRRLKR